MMGKSKAWWRGVLTCYDLRSQVTPLKKV